MKKVLLILSLVVVACNNNKSSDIKDVDLSIEKLSHIKPIYRDPIAMFYNEQDETLLINIRDDDNCVQRINLISGEYENLIKTGRGRDEYIQLRLLDMDENGDFYGKEFRSYLSFSRDGALLSSYNSDETNINIFFANRFKGANIVYGNFNHPKSLLTIFDESWREISHFGEFPKDGISEAKGGEMGKIMAYQGVILSNDTLSKVAFVSYQGKFFSIFDIDSEFNAEMTYNIQQNLPKYRNSGGSGMGVVFSSLTFYYISACNSDNFIYILYSGKDMGENSNMGFYSANRSNVILVYDWNGNHLYNLHSDQELTAICVDRDDSNIIATYYDDEYGIQFCRFDISELGDI